MIGTRFMLPKSRLLVKYATHTFALDKKFHSLEARTYLLEKSNLFPLYLRIFQTPTPIRYNTYVNGTRRIVDPEARTCSHIDHVTLIKLYTTKDVISIQMLNSN